jgi:hypothetical protein
MDWFLPDGYPYSDDDDDETAAEYNTWAEVALREARELAGGREVVFCVDPIGSYVSRGRPRLSVAEFWRRCIRPAAAADVSVAVWTDSGCWGDGFAEEIVPYLEKTIDSIINPELTRP